MANPTKPKDVKPKTDEEENKKPEGEKIKLNINFANVLTNVGITCIVCLCFLVANYFMMQGIQSNSVAQNQQAVEEAEGEGAEEEIQERGIILDLGEFILNLSDANAKKYLKVSVAIELTKTNNDMALLNKKPEGGGHGEAPVDPMKAIENEMEQYRPSVRDAIISVLSSKTSEELFTVPGKELSKEQIKEAIDAIFAGEREVIRVSFGNFLIQ